MFVIREHTTLIEEGLVYFDNDNDNDNQWFIETIIIQCLKLDCICFLYFNEHIYYIIHRTCTSGIIVYK